MNLLASFILLLIFAGISVYSIFWLSERIEKRSKMMQTLINMCSAYDMRHAADPDPGFDALFWYELTFTDDKRLSMLFSFRPLTLQEWVPPDILQKLEND